MVYRDYIQRRGKTVVTDPEVSLFQNGGGYLNLDQIRVDNSCAPPYQDQIR